MTLQRFTGYLSLRRLTAGESRWFATAGREFGLWYLTIHAGLLYFGIIGPFTRRSK